MKWNLLFVAFSGKAKFEAVTAKVLGVGLLLHAAHVVVDIIYGLAAKAVTSKLLGAGGSDSAKKDVEEKAK